MKGLFVFALVLGVATAACPAGYKCCVSRTYCDNISEEELANTCCPDFYECCSADGAFIPGVSSFQCCDTRAGAKCDVDPDNIFAGNQCIITGPPPTPRPTAMPTAPPGQCRSGAQKLIDMTGAAWDHPCPPGSHLESQAGAGTETYCCPDVTTKFQCGNFLSCSACMSDALNGACVFIPGGIGCIEAPAGPCLVDECVESAAQCPVALSGTCWHRCGAPGWGDATRMSPFMNYGSPNAATECHCTEGCEETGVCCEDYKPYCRV